MKTFFLGILVALFLVGASFAAHVAYRRAQFAEMSASYLFGPSGVVDEHGAAVSRQQLLDSYLHMQIETHPEWHLHFVAK